MHPPVTNRSDFFSWRGFSIHQADDVLKVGTDAVLLGSWIGEVIPLAQMVLDAGTGTGILALAVAGYFPDATIYAADIEENAIALAQLNVDHAGFQNRIKVCQGDLLDDSFLSSSKFDLIISNPPFYTTRILPKDEHLAVAKHSAVSASVWMKHLVDRTEVEGHLCLIVPAEAAHHWIKAANASGFYIHHRLDVYSFADDVMAKRSMLHFALQLCKPEMSRLVMYDVGNTYTEDYLKMSGIQPAQNQPREGDKKEKR